MGATVTMCTLGAHGVLKMPTDMNTDFPVLAIPILAAVVSLPVAMFVFCRSPNAGHVWCKLLRMLSFGTAIFLAFWGACHPTNAGHTVSTIHQVFDVLRDVGAYASGIAAFTIPFPEETPAKPADSRSINDSLKASEKFNDAPEAEAFRDALPTVEKKPKPQRTLSGTTYGTVIQGEAEESSDDSSSSTKAPSAAERIQRYEEAPAPGRGLTIPPSELLVEKGDLALDDPAAAKTASPSPSGSPRGSGAAQPQRSVSPSPENAPKKRAQSADCAAGKSRAISELEGALGQPSASYIIGEHRGSA